MTGADTPRRRRAAVRRVRLAAAGRARRRRSATCSTAADARRPSGSSRPVDVRRRASRAPGLLRAFNDAGVLGAADVHVALRLGRARRARPTTTVAARGGARRARRRGSATSSSTSRRSRETATVDAEDEAGRPADAAVAGRRRTGSRGWRRARSSRSARTGPPNRPLRLDRHPRSTSTATGARSAQSPPTCARRGGRRAGVDDRARSRRACDRLFAGDGRDDAPARSRAAAAVRRRFAVVAGGPGTGKTTTVARIAGAARRAGRRAACRRRGRARRADRQGRRAAGGGGPRRGRATLALERRVRDALLGLQRVDAAPPARLAARQPQPLPPRPRQPAAARRRDRRRDLDGLAVADGAARSRRCGRDARLVLVGDPDQLASVEAGAVLGDIVGPRRDGRLVVLDPRPASAAGSPTWRARSAAATPTRSLAVLRARAAKTCTLDRRDVAAAGGAMHELAGVRDGRAGRRAGRDRARRGPATPRRALDALGAFRVLCAHRRGAVRRRDVDGAHRGVAGRVELRPRALVRGRPLLVTENDYGLRLYNGDTGVVVGDAPGGGAARRSSAAARSSSSARRGSRRRRHRLRDDGPQEPGLAVRDGGRRCCPPRPRRSSPASCSTPRSRARRRSWSSSGPETPCARRWATRRARVRAAGPPPGVA